MNLFAMLSADVKPMGYYTTMKADRHKVTQTRKKRFMEEPSLSSLIAQVNYSIAFDGLIRTEKELAIRARRNRKTIRDQMNVYLQMEPPLVKFHGDNRWEWIGEIPEITPDKRMLNCTSVAVAACIADTDKRYRKAMKDETLPTAEIARRVGAKGGPAGILKTLRALVERGTVEQVGTASQLGLGKTREWYWRIK